MVSKICVNHFLICDSLKAEIMSVILIGGTPGTGKTKAASILASRLSIEVMSLGDIAVNGGCIKTQDIMRDTGVIDEDCLVDEIIQVLEKKKGRIVLEGHYIDLVPSRSIECAILLRTHPEVLLPRLIKRGYDESKIKENIEAEVLGVCQLDAISSFGEESVFEIDTSELTPVQTAERIQKVLQGQESTNRIDWMELLESEGRLDDYLQE